jgi:hypothetical protein
MTFVSTCLGGLLALRVRDRLHLLLGFSSGAILGVVFFDILPEVVARAAAYQLDLATALLFTAAGFLAFFALERVTKSVLAALRTSPSPPRVALFDTRDILGKTSKNFVRVCVSSSPR